MTRGSERPIGIDELGSSYITCAAGMAVNGMQNAQRGLGYLPNTSNVVLPHMLEMWMDVAGLEMLKVEQEEG